jgi:Domain of unknown function (DUF4118)
VLIDHEAWVCDLEARDINGPARRIQLYRLWTGGLFVRREPRTDRGDEGRGGAVLRSAPRKLRVARLLFRPIVAMLPVAIAFCPQWVLWPAMSPWAWLLLYAGVFFRSWLGGLRVGLFAMAMSTQSSGIFFLPPERPLKVADSVYVFWRAVSAFRASSSASSTST